MAHAHPLPDGLGLPLNQSHHSQISSYSSSMVASPASRTLASQRQQESISRQNRRLQLRNAGFRGPVIQPRRVSPFLTSPPQIPDAPTFSINNENSPKSTERRTLYGEDLPPSPVSILQEISNSSRRKRNSPKPGLNTVWQDSTATEPSMEPTSTSWYHEISTTSSSFPYFDTPSKMMKLREGSLNEKTPPPVSSPLAKQVKGRRKQSLDPRSTSFEASKYIEHLESQLASLNTKLDALTSPTTTKTHSAKLRALTAESRSLRNELSEWESNFEERVKDERDQRSDIESVLRSRIRALEDEVEIKDAKIRELEWELESTVGKARGAESLEITNLDLERRIDVLTGLLAQSPTKLDFRSAISSPVKPDPTKRSTRPKSMLPRIPSSSSGVRLSTNAATESTWSNTTKFTSASISEDPENRLPLYFDKGPDTQAEATVQSRHHQSMDSGSSMSTSFRSGTFSSSRPSSMISDSSINASWGLSLPDTVEDQAKSTGRTRRMRRFPSGSCTLKPLILPTAAVTLSLPASAPVYSNYDSPRRDISNVSLDPTTAFLSQPEYSSPFSTPTQPARRRSATWAQNETPLAHREFATTSIIKHHQKEGETLSSGPNMERARDSQNEEHIPFDSHTRTLMMELEMAENQAHGTIGEASSTPNESEPMLSVDLILPPFELDSVMVERPQQEVMSCNSLRRRNPPTLADIFPRLPNTKESDEKSSAGEGVKEVMIRATTFGLFSRLISLITSMKQDPVVLARRILRNAWICGTSGLGGVGWWLLGLLFGSRGQKRKPTADPKIVEEEPGSDFDWHYYSAEASKARRFEQCWQSENLSLEVIGSGAMRPNFSDGDVPNAYVPAAQCSSTAFETRGVSEGLYSFRCKDCVEPASRRNLRLWCRFSLAIILAVGVAIKNGPGTLLTDDLRPRGTAKPIRSDDNDDPDSLSIVSDCNGQPDKKLSSLRKTSKSLSG